MTTSEVIIGPDKDAATRAKEEQIEAGVPNANIKIVQVERQSSHSVPDEHEVTVTNRTESPVWVVMIISAEVE